MQLPEAASGVAQGEPVRVGQFVYRVEHDQWWWSEDLFRIYGYEPGEVSPATEVLLGHKHPDDLEHTREALRRALEHGEPFSCYHRIIDAQGRTRHVAGVADASLAPDGTVHELRGYLVDLTRPRRHDVAEQTAEALRGAAEHRAVIDQAKGILMFVYSLDADTAFAVLSARSQANNIKVRELAEMVTAGSKVLQPTRSSEQRLTHLLECGARWQLDEALEDPAVGS